MTDVVWVIDESNSIGEPNYDILRQEIKALTDNFEYGSLFRYGLIEFSGTGLNAQPGVPNYLEYYFEETGILNHYPSTDLEQIAIQTVIDVDQHPTKAEFLSAIDALTYQELVPGSTFSYDGFTWNTSERGFTCISCAFQYSLDEYYPRNYNPSVENIMIFVGDGQPNRGFPLSPEEPLRILRENYDFKMIFIPIGSSINTDVLGSSFQSGEYQSDVILGINSYAELTAAFELLIDCNDTTRR